VGEDLEKLAADLDEETNRLRKSADADADVSPNAPVPDEVKKEQAELEEQLREPLTKLEELAGA
jgi:hypothetical protein